MNHFIQWRSSALHWRGYSFIFGLNQITRITSKSAATMAPALMPKGVGFRESIYATSSGINSLGAAATRASRAVHSFSAR